MKQKSSTMFTLFYLVNLITALACMQSCKKCIPCKTDTQPPISQQAGPDANNPKELNFDVKNETGKTVYVTCFTYERRLDFGHWRWNKSPVYKLDDSQTVTIDIEGIPNEQDRAHVFGYLGVFNDQQSADDAIYELADERTLLDLDLLIQLKGKLVTLSIEKYGSKGVILEYDFINKEKSEVAERNKIPKLDFPVENKTGKPILVTCFSYEKKAKGRWIAATEEKDDMAVWRFDKSPIIKLMPDEIGMITIDPIPGNRDRAYVRGFLAVFDEDEGILAQQSTFELLDTKYKLNIGELPRLKNKKIVIEVEKYGIMQDAIDYIIKPAGNIDFITLKRK